MGREIVDSRENLAASGSLAGDIRVPSVVDGHEERFLLLYTRRSALEPRGK